MPMKETGLHSVSTILALAIERHAKVFDFGHYPGCCLPGSSFSIDPIWIAYDPKWIPRFETFV